MSKWIDFSLDERKAMILGKGLPFVRGVPERRTEDAQNDTSFL
ncbi:hypothetical protein [Prevotella sp. E13-27]|nr:hypothetical protein [Prevotella sp. E13-27]